MNCKSCGRQSITGEALTNYALQIAVDELLQDHFLSPCHRRSFLEEKVFQFIELLQGQKITKGVNG